MPDRRPDLRAAVRATALTLAVLGMFTLAQGAVVALVTGGDQPMGVVERVPTDPRATDWAEAPSRTVNLSRQQMALPFGGGSTNTLRVQALTNDSHVSFRLSWPDPTNDTSIAAPTAFSDAAAIMFRGGDIPPITMGAVGKPVNIWYWRASWQYGSEPAEWTGDMYSYPHADNRTKPGLQAGNPLSQAPFDRYGQNYYAKGFGSLSAAPAQNIDATATRTDEGWQVTFVRERATNGTYDAAFDEHDKLYVAFAVWNGSAGEANGQKSLTLQFTSLDTKSGELAAAQPPGGGGDGGGGGGPATPVAPDGSPLLGWTAVLIAVALVTWLVAYWRMRP